MCKLRRVRRAAFPRFFLYFLIVQSSAFAGVLVMRNANGLHFSDAISISVNGKDKVLDVGGDPRLEQPLNKLSSTKLEGVSLLKEKATGALVLLSDSGLTYTAPEGLGKAAPSTLTAAWQGIGIGYKRAKSDKEGNQISVAEFVGFFDGGVAEVVTVCANEQLLTVIGGAGKAFDTQLELIGATAKAFAADPSTAELQRFVERGMRTRLERFESGTADVQVLAQALRLADLSAEIYPKIPEQIALREQIGKRKVWLDRRVAVLHAFAAGTEWDQYLLAERDFDRYEPVFPDLVLIRTKALHASLEAHTANGEEYLKGREYGAALREFRTASLRQPSDKLLSQKVLMAWANYSREMANDNRSNRKQLSEGEREVLNRAIQFATNYKSENRLEPALKSIEEAEAIDPNSMRMLLTKAEILGAQRSFSDAFAALDRYDLLAVDEEREKSSALRNDLLFRQKSSVEDIKEQIRKAWDAGTYHKLHELALDGLKAKDDDGELLYQAAIASLITREPDRAATFLTRYLAVTNTLDADPEQRARARSVLGNIKNNKLPQSGEPNWLSGQRLPSNVYYDPVSLAFQPPIERIEASGKMRISFDWEGNKLLTIVPTFEKADKDTGEKPVSFTYNDQFPQVLMATNGKALPKPATSDPDEILKASSVVLLNNPYIDPDAVEKLTGKSIALVVSGNRYFEPFVWDRVHYFRLKYDYAGRVQEAHEIADPKATTSDFALQFDWDGQQLTAIRGYEGSDRNHRRQVYERTMQYDGHRLVAESIQSGNKSSHIKYNYSGDRLVSANSSNDQSLDNRSRQVTFR
jgi:hypothetical protein